MLGSNAKDKVIPVRYITHLAAVLQQQGHNLPALLGAANIDSQTISNPDAWLTMQQLDLLIPVGRQITGRSDLALELGKTIRLSTHSIVGYGILSSPSIGYALQLASRYFSLILPPFQLRFFIDGAYAELSYEPIHPIQHETLCFLLEALAVATHRDLEELLGRRPPEHDIFLSIPAPLHAARYAELAAARVHFAATPNDMQRPGLRMRFPAELMERSPMLADPSALNVAEERCRALVQRTVSSGSMSDWVRMMLRESSGGMPDIKELAHSQNLSTRTLDRYLRREGVGFRELLKQERHTKACRLLDANELDITQIAYELGYSDPANFTRAFRREAGNSPRAYRSLSAQLIYAPDTQK